MLEFICKRCGILAFKKYPSDKRTYCSKKCKYDSLAEIPRIGITRFSADCAECGINISRKGLRRSVKHSKSGLVYCSLSCKQKYQVKHNPKYFIRSKCEILLVEKLRERFPTLIILENDKIVLDGLELDILIPELKLAIEWNGDIHRKPFFGEDKLEKIQLRDAKKKEKAMEVGIDLIVIEDYHSREWFVLEKVIEISKSIEEKMRG